MTAEFNITIPGAEIIKRLADLENGQRITNATVSSVIDNYDRLADRLDDFEIEMSTKTNTLSDRMDVLTDIAHGRVRPADAPDDFASASRVERIAEDLAILRRELNLAIANGREETQLVNDRLEKLEDAIDWHDGANMENGHAPNLPANDPEPPVDTSWHPYDVLVDGVIHDHPTGDKRVVAMTRSGLIDGPFTAQHAHWDERGVMTIVAWRYAKEGE